MNLTEEEIDFILIRIKESEKCKIEKCLSCILYNKAKKLAHTGFYTGNYIPKQECCKELFKEFIGEQKIDR